MSDEQAIGETGTYAEGHRGMGWDNRLRIANAFITIVAEQLHYYDRSQSVDLRTCKYADIIEMAEGALDRYRNDPIFHAKVIGIVSRLTQEIDRCSQ